MPWPPTTTPSRRPRPSHLSTHLGRPPLHRSASHGLAAKLPPQPYLAAATLGRRPRLGRGAAPSALATHHCTTPSATAQPWRHPALAARRHTRPPATAEPPLPSRRPFSPGHSPPHYATDRGSAVAPSHLGCSLAHEAASCGRATTQIHHHLAAPPRVRPPPPGYRTSRPPITTRLPHPASAHRHSATSPRVCMLPPRLPHIASAYRPPTTRVGGGA